ncbi:D-alanine--D-serine ligase VanG [Bacillus sp. Bva_UNVM-123]|uniref:D-alanine--D-serine ligase VanG n=1 Tax=Bacillus sp. Bva_UNVM-123 TaxID=2829798 RepID=UPI00391F0CC9
MEKKKIAIIFGGCSTEYEVSLKSASAVIKHVNYNLYETILIGITRQGKWLKYNGDLDKIANNTWSEDESCIPTIISPSRDVHGLLEFHKNNLQITEIDAAFPILHGRNGEDGTIQGLLELAGIPVIGCDMLSSAICMDKWLAHTLVEQAGIKVPRSIVINDKISESELLEKIKSFSLPLFMKPVRAGSSFGITKVYKRNDLFKAAVNAFEYDNKVIIEENISGFEVGCAILGNDELMIGEVDEIELESGFFDYQEKYTLQNSNIHLPARVDSQTTNKIKHIAKTIYRVLGCKGFARVDLFLTPDGDLYFNEVNTIPGFTAHSRFPNMLKSGGMSFEEILERIIRLGVEQ